MAESSIDVRALYNFIHQVVNPLNGVVGTVDNIIDGHVKGDPVQRLKVVRAQLEHSIELIRNMAYLSRLAIPNELSRLKDAPQKCVIPELIIQAAQFFQESEAEVGIELLDPETQFVVSGNRDLLRQVFMNLFDNAVKYADKNTSVKVATRVQKSTGFLIVEVVNEGVGFDNSDKEAIFSLGYRSKEAEQHTAEGSGIGLYLCKQILEVIFSASIDAEHQVAKRLTVIRIKFPTFKNEGKKKLPRRS